MTFGTMRIGARQQTIRRACVNRRQRTVSFETHGASSTAVIGMVATSRYVSLFAIAGGLLMLGGGLCATGFAVEALDDSPGAPGYAGLGWMMMGALGLAVAGGAGLIAITMMILRRDISVASAQSVGLFGLAFGGIAMVPSILLEARYLRGTTTGAWGDLPWMGVGALALLLPLGFMVVRTARRGEATAARPRVLPAAGVGLVVFGVALGAAYVLGAFVLPGFPTLISTFHALASLTALGVAGAMVAATFVRPQNARAALVVGLALIVPAVGMYLVRFIPVARVFVALAVAAWVVFEGVRGLSRSA